MADNPFGLSFSPLTQNLPQQGSYAQPGGGPLQSAVQTLGLRRPTTYGAQAPAPEQLLNSAGGSGIPGLDEFLKMLERASQGDRTLPPADPLGASVRETQPGFPQTPIPNFVYKQPAPDFPGGTAGYAPERPGGIPTFRRG